MYDLKVVIGLGCCLCQVEYILYLAQTQVYFVKLKFDLKLGLILFRKSLIKNPRLNTFKCVPKKLLEFCNFSQNQHQAIIVLQKLWKEIKYVVNKDCWSDQVLRWDAVAPKSRQDWVMKSRSEMAHTCWLLCVIARLHKETEKTKKEEDEGRRGEKRMMLLSDRENGD